MGAWGLGPFDNDGAVDLIAQLDDVDHAGQTAVIRNALVTAAAGNRYLDIDDASMALAAAAIVALARGPVPGVTDVPDAVKPHTIDLSRDLLTLAVQAVDRIAGPDSEWLDLWSEGGSPDDALTMIAAVRSALTGP